jgi:hypothetical protein
MSIVGRWRLRELACSAWWAQRSSGGTNK